MKHPEFLSAFTTSSPQKVGVLEVASGKIVACDPLADPEHGAFARTIPTGRYPVYVYYDPNDDRIGLAELRFGNGSPVRWEMATLEGQDIHSLADDQIFGYPVDAGMGCFMDVKGQEAMLEHEQQLMEEMGDSFCSYYDDVIDPLLYGSVDAIDEEDATSRDAVNHTPLDDRSDNVIMFTSGWGDGYYSSWWGFNEADQPVCLITDFGLFREES